MANEERYEKVQREKIRQTKRETKPSARRGYKRKYTKGVGLESVPRSGFFSAFLSTFSLFLVILVLFNVVMGTGYTGYKVTVNTLLVFTETIGNLVRGVFGGLIGYDSVREFKIGEYDDIYLNNEIIIDGLVQQVNITSVGYIYYFEDDSYVFLAKAVEKDINVRFTNSSKMLVLFSNNSNINSNTFVEVKYRFLKGWEIEKNGNTIMSKKRDSIHYKWDKYPYKYKKSILSSQWLNIGEI